MKKIKGFFGGVTKNVWFGIKSCFYASKKYFLLKCLVLLSQTFIPLTTIWLWRGILNGITEDITNNKNTILLYLAIYLTLTLFTNILERFDRYINGRYNDELQFYIEAVMMEKSSRMDLSFFDSASMGDKVRHARSNFRTCSH